MSPSGVRLTRAGWVALAVAGLLVVTGLTVVVLRLTGSPDCVVRSGSRTVDLDQHQAERAATAVAPVVRRAGGPSAAASAVAHAAGTSGEDSRLVADALTGRSAEALSCRHGGASTSEPDRLDAGGLTGRAEAVREDVLDAFGPLPLGGFAPGGVHSGHMPGSAHYEGRAIDVFFRPVSAADKVRGWALAQYLVAQAARLSIDTVIFDARIWTAQRAADGWRDYRVDPSGKSPAVLRVLEHRDHVHVDVAD
ncbi:hypothetical protein ACVW00_004045 [Marmoricola sp. URHA0025 HA25]